MLKPGFLLTPKPDMLGKDRRLVRSGDRAERACARVCASVHLLMVNGCLACCCLAMPMMLGEPRLGLPMLLLLAAPTPALAPPLSPPTMPPVCPVGPPTCWLWFSTLRLLSGRIPLHRRGSVSRAVPHPEDTTAKHQLQTNIPGTNGCFCSSAKPKAAESGAVPGVCGLPAGRGWRVHGAGAGRTGVTGQLTGRRVQTASA